MPTRDRRRRWLAAAALAITVTGGACSDDAPAKTLAVEAGERGAAMYFDPDAPSTAAGSYTVTLDNVGSTHHDLAFISASGATVAGRSTGPRTTVSFDVELEPGTYRMLCREPGHEAAGMVGALTVTP